MADNLLAKVAHRLLARGLATLHMQWSSMFAYYAVHVAQSVANRIHEGTLLVLICYFRRRQVVGVGGRHEDSESSSFCCVSSDEKVAEYLANLFTLRRIKWRVEGIRTSPRRLECLILCQDSGKEC